MNSNQAQYDWIFALQWLAVCALGLLLGGMFAFASIWNVGAAVENAVGETAAYLALGGLFGAIFGLSANLGPGLLLQSRGLPGIRWILASILAGALGAGFGIAFVFTFLEPDTLSEAVTGSMIGIFLGLPIGVGQWLALRPRNLLAGQWVLISSLAFVIGVMIGLPLGGEGREWISLSVMGMLIGAITGLGVISSLRWRTEQAT